MARPHTKYPALFEILDEMFRDNYGTLYRQHVKPVRQWVWPPEVDVLERTAASLTRDERLTLASGEHTAQTRIVRKYKCHRLHQFINDVFDGCQSQNFIKV